MRRVLALLTLTALGALPVTALAAASKQHHVTDHLVGALIQSHGSSSTYAYKVQANDAGSGAVVSVSTSTSSTGGKTHGVAYFADGSVRSVGTYRIGAANSNGVIPLTFSGHDTGGTGVFKGIRGTYHGTGTDNSKTHIVRLTLTGTDTY